MVNKEQDFRAKIKSWLEKQGYPLEMTVAREFRKRPFRVHQSHYFSDPNTSESREIDILITRQDDIDGRFVRVVFVIECKLSRDKPWVVFTDESIKIPDSRRISQQTANGFGSRLLTAFADDPLLAGTGLFVIPERPGYSVTTALLKGEGKDRAYSAISSVAAATSALVEVLDRAPLAAVLFPIIVLDGPLFDCHLDREGGIEVVEAGSAVLLWRNPIAHAPLPVIHIVTSAHLGHLVSAAEATANCLFALDANQVGQTLGRPTGIVSRDDPTVDF